MRRSHNPNNVTSKPFHPLRSHIQYAPLIEWGQHLPYTFCAECGALLLWDELPIGPAMCLDCVSLANTGELCHMD
jgi:hypothetical protein